MIERIDADAPERSASWRGGKDLLEVMPENGHPIGRCRRDDGGGLRNAGAEQEQRGGWQQSGVREGTATGQATRRQAFT